MTEPSRPSPAEGQVASPCNGVCTVDPRTGWCLGCQRTLDEIGAWSTLGDPEKRTVWAALEARRVEVARGTP